MRQVAPGEATKVPVREQHLAYTLPLWRVSFPTKDGRVVILTPGPSASQVRIHAQRVLGRMDITVGRYLRSPKPRPAPARH